MKIPNYDSELVADKTKHKSLLGNDLRMLVCGSSGCGKTNTLMHIIKKPLCYHDQIIIYTPNKDQDKLVSLKNKFAQVFQLVGHQVLLLCGQEDILNTDEYESDDCVKLVVFDDLMNADKKIQAKIANHFTDGIHHKIFPVYLSQSYFTIPKDIRTNCSKVIVYDPPTDGEETRISKECRFDKCNFEGLDKHDFLFINQNNRESFKNFDELT